jgi:hypothetical protein
MSSRLNMNPIRFFSWKGKTFNQITSKIQKNTTNITDDTLIRNFFLPLPLKIYRREIGNVPSSSSIYPNVCNPRKSITINEIDMPNGTIVNSAKDTNSNGLANTLDINLTTNTTERSPSCNTCVMTAADNARRRVRSSGMIKKQFDVSTNIESYCTSTNQYLIARNKSFSQNQYKYIRQGNASLNPSNSLSSHNVYTGSGFYNCRKFQITADTSFAYKWFDSLEYTVDISAGYYSIEDVNNFFKAAMSTNYHYLVQNNTNTQIFFMDFAYNNAYKKIEMQLFKVNSTIFNTTDYSMPIDPVSQIRAPISTWTLPDEGDNNVISIRILNNDFVNAIGFSAGYYPTLPVTNNEITSNLVFLSNVDFGLKSVYVPVYYKPNNPQFGQQGSVSSSELTSRLRYTTISNDTARFRNPSGICIVNALAYGVPENGYTVKEKIGYSMKKTPTFSKYSDEMKKCTVRTLRNAI